MAIVQMQRVRVCGLRRQRSISSSCCRGAGAVEIDEPDRQEEGL
ncbi:MAG: hypothetical protein ACLU9S_21695 [Oscillospiraceae bacterium]